jgi:hypothetical protein
MALSNAERQAQWRERRKAELEALRNKQGRADPAEVKALKARIRHLEEERSRMLGQLRRDGVLSRSNEGNG